MNSSSQGAEHSASRRPEAQSDLEVLADRLRGSVTKSGGVDLRDPALLLNAAATLERVVAERDGWKERAGILAATLEWEGAQRDRVAAQVEAVRGKRHNALGTVACTECTPPKAEAE